MRDCGSAWNSCRLSHEPTSAPKGHRATEYSVSAGSRFARANAFNGKNAFSYQMSDLKEMCTEKAWLRKSIFTLQNIPLCCRLKPGWSERSEAWRGRRPSGASVAKRRPGGGPLTPACARLKGGRRLVTAAVFVGYKRRPPPRAGGQREAKRSVGRRQEAVAIKRRL